MLSMPAPWKVLTMAQILLQSNQQKVALKYVQINKISHPLSPSLRLVSRPLVMCPLALFACVVLFLAGGVLPSPSFTPRLH